MTHANRTEQHTQNGAVAVHPTDTTELVSRCVCDEADAKAQFYNEYHLLVERAIIRKLALLLGEHPLRADVEDVRDDVFERLFAGQDSPLAQLKRPRAITSWLITLAGNLAVDHVRRWVRHERIRDSLAREPEPPYGISPEDAAITGEQRARLNASLAELSAADRLVLELYYLHGLKYAEVAEVMGLKLNTMAARLRRAKSKLRTLLETGDGNVA